MGRTIAVIWHVAFSVVAGVLYFFFVLPRWPELMGQTSPTLGTALRIVTGILIAMAALPVVFTQLRTRKPEYGIPQLALTVRLWSIAAHVLAGVLIVGTAISEIWLNLDSVGQWLFGIYGAAAALALIGIFGFYLSFVAELPPPPPKPLKPKKPKKPEKRQRRNKRAGDDEQASTEPAEDDESGDGEIQDTEEAEAEATETDEAEAQEAEATETDEAEAEAEATEAAEAVTDEAEKLETEVTAEILEPESTTQAPRAGLGNRRPTGKSRRHSLPRGGARAKE